MTSSGGLLAHFDAWRLEEKRENNRTKDLNVRYFIATTAPTIIVQRLLANHLSSIRFYETNKGLFRFIASTMSSQCRIASAMLT